MIRLLLLILPALMWGQSYPDIIALLDRSMMVQSSEQLEKAALESYKAAEGKSLPALEGRLGLTRLEEVPTATFGTAKVPMGTKNRSVGELTLTYPLFSGFAISASIEKAKLSHDKAVLQVLDLKRNLYLNATRLCSAVAAADAIIAAQHEAKKAIEESYKKAKGLYDNGVLAPAELYAIEAKGYEIDAQLIQTRNAKRQALNELSYLTGIPITEAILPAAAFGEPPREEIMKSALSRREDLLAVEKALDIARTDVTLAQSRFYPEVVVAGSLKRQGDTLELNGDGYTNADQSYVAIMTSWNLFSGMGDTHAAHAAQAAQRAATIALEDYKRRIATDIDDTLLEIESTKSRLHSAQAQITAAEAYAGLSRGRFENQLASADEMSRAVADLAAAKAKAARLESELFYRIAALWLNGGIEAYREKVARLSP